MFENDLSAPASNMDRPVTPHLHITARHELGRDRREAAVDDGFPQRKGGAQAVWLPIVLYHTAPYPMLLRSQQKLSSPPTCPAHPRVDRELQTKPSCKTASSILICMHETCELHLRDSRTQDKSCLLAVGKRYPPSPPAGCRLSRFRDGDGGGGFLASRSRPPSDLGRARQQSHSHML